MDTTRRAMAVAGTAISQGAHDEEVARFLQQRAPGGNAQRRPQPQEGERAFRDQHVGEMEGEDHRQHGPQPRQQMPQQNARRAYGHDAGRRYVVLGQQAQALGIHHAGEDRPAEQPQRDAERPENPGLPRSR